MQERLDERPVRSARCRGRSLALLGAASLLVAACASNGDDDSADGVDDSADGVDTAADQNAAESTDGGAEAASDCSAALVLGANGLGDQSFNDSANAGIERAGEELGVEISVIESAADTDIEINLIDAAEDNDVAFAIGFQTVDAVAAAAETDPDTYFGIVDAEVEAPNVASLLFDEPEGAFLAGVVAAEMSESGTIGFVGGLEIPLIEGFWAGYEAGATTVDPDIEVLVNYAGAFDDPGRGKEIALAQYGDGADVVFHAAGGTGLGVFEAANEEGKYVIGVDADQIDLAPDLTLTSLMKRVDVAVFETIEDVCNSEFEAGTTVYDLEVNGLALADSTSTNTPQEVIDLADDYRQQIIDGEIEVPSNGEELEQFEG